MNAHEYALIKDECSSVEFATPLAVKLALCMHITFHDVLQLYEVLNQPDLCPPDNDKLPTVDYHSVRKCFTTDHYIQFI